MCVCVHMYAYASLQENRSVFMKLIWTSMLMLVLPLVTFYVSFHWLFNGESSLQLTLSRYVYLIIDICVIHTILPGTVLSLNFNSRLLYSAIASVAAVQVIVAWFVVTALREEVPEIDLKETYSPDKSKKRR